MRFKFHPLYCFIIILSTIVCLQEEVYTRYVKRVGKNRYVGYVLFKKMEENETSYLMLRPEWQDRWILPEGRVRFGETRQLAVRRVLREVTGFFVTDISFGTTEQILYPENKTTYWIALLWNNVKEVKLPTNYLAYKWCAYDEAYELADRLTRRLLSEAKPYVTSIDFLYYF